MIGRAAVLRLTAVLGAYLAITALYTHPLLWRLADGVANDRYDPVLNASILWWNATTVPFSTTWWTPPHYYPSQGVAAFTENLVGLWPIATPISWATQNALVAHNLAVFLTWPLSALGAYFLARQLGASRIASFIGGLAFGFAPYRISQIGHLQVLSCFWLPVALAALHGYLQQRRTWWLALFGAAWILQSLSNGYFMLFGGVLIGMWLVYFCSTRSTWRAAGPILVAWVIATLPLIPVMLVYRQIHHSYGLVRHLTAILQYSATPGAWLSTSEMSMFWGPRLPNAGNEWNLFPGLTAVLLVLGAATWTLFGARSPDPTQPPPAGRGRRVLLSACLLTLAVSAAAAVWLLVAGPWRMTFAGLPVRVGSLSRPVLVAVLALLVFRAFGGRWRHAGERKPLAFYAIATLVIAVFSMGPRIRAAGRVVMDPAPYAWLMLLPGFEGLRVPTRFWIIGSLCLAAAVALAFDKLAPAHRGGRILLATLLASGVLADGWLRVMPIGEAPALWPDVEPPGTGRALLELPLGPEWDAAATYRAAHHRRRVVNGVSGHEPPHYPLLQLGLEARDPGVLTAIASLGPLDVVVNGAGDRDREWSRYVAATPGAEQVASDGERTAYRVPAEAAHAQAFGEAWPVVTAMLPNGDGDARAVMDGDLASRWSSQVQVSGMTLTLDLGSTRTVAGVSQAIGRWISDYPRQLVVETSLDGSRWSPAWQGRGLGPAIAGVMRASNESRLLMPFTPREARLVRLRLVSDALASWTIAEVTAHGPR